MLINDNRSRKKSQVGNEQKNRSVKHGISKTQKVLLARRAWH